MQGSPYTSGFAYNAKYKTQLYIVLENRLEVGRAQLGGMTSLIEVQYADQRFNFNVFESHPHFNFWITA